MTTESWRIKDWIVGLKVVFLEKHILPLNETCSGNLSREVLWAGEEGHWPFKTETCWPDPQGNPKAPHLIPSIPKRTSSFHYDVSSFHAWVFVCTCICIWAPHACLVPEEARRGHGTPGTGVTDSGGPPCWLRIKPISSPRAASALTHGITSPTPNLLLSLMK